MEQSLKDNLQDMVIEIIKHLGAIFERLLARYGDVCFISQHTLFFQHFLCLGGFMLAPSWPMLSQIGSILGPRWAIVAHLGAMLGDLEAML